MRFGKLLAVCAIAPVLSACVSLPPYQPMTDKTAGDWKQCRSDSVWAKAHQDEANGSGAAILVAGVLGGGIGGAVAGAANSGFDYRGYIGKCMSDKGYSLPPDYHGSLGE